MKAHASREIEMTVFLPYGDNHLIIKRVPFPCQISIQEVFFRLKTAIYIGAIRY
jgi:hypothetical protein